MKTKLIFLSLLVVSILQGSEHNSLGVFYPGSSKPLITVSPWDDATNEEISLRTKTSFINQKQFPVGNFVYLINEINNNFSIEVIKYNQQLNKYEKPIKIEHELLDLNLQDCSYVVYNGGKGLEYDSLSLGAEFINKLYENNIRCAINYPVNNKTEILPLIGDKKVHYHPCWNDIKEQLTAYGFTFWVLALVWYINPFNSLLI
jgi:hypothetical protein